MGDRINKTVRIGELLSSQENVSSESSDVELTEEEKQQILADAKFKKQMRLDEEARQKRREELDHELRRPWNSTDMLNFITWKAKNKYGIDFVLDESNHEVVRILCRYFTNDKRFEEMGEGYSLNKGIMLAGNVGTGKTTLMRLFTGNKKASFNMMPSRKLADMFGDKGPEILHFYSKLISCPSSSDTFFQNKIGLCFDDLGTERKGKRYGDSANVMEEVLLNRYDNSDAEWFFTHLTTNLTADEIETTYGTRVRSRSREMFNLVTLDGEDRRK